MPTDPSIILASNAATGANWQGQDPQNILRILDAAQAYKANQLQFAQQLQAVQRQNSVNALIGQPGALDDSGGPTPETLTKIAKVGGADMYMKYLDASAQAQERQAQAQNMSSEASIRRQGEFTSMIADAMDDYDSKMAGASDQEKAVIGFGLKERLHDEIMAQQNVSDKDKQAMWARISTLDPVGLRKLSLTQQQRFQMQKAQFQADLGRTPYTDSSTGQTVFVSKAGEAYNEDGQRVEIKGELVRPITPVDPHRLAIEQQQAAGQGWQFLQSPDGKMYRGNVRTGAVEPVEGAKDLTKLGGPGSGAGASLSEDAVEITAEQVLAGDRSALMNLGRGAQNAANLAKIRNRVAELAKDRGLTGQDLANIDAEFFGQRAGESFLGRRGAQLSQAGRALDQAIGQSHAAYAKLPRGQFVPFNKLQRLVDEGTSSPEQAAAHTADQFVINAWARAINPTGVLTVENTRKGAEMLSGATSQEAHDAVLNQMRREVEAESESVPGARSDVRREAGPGSAVHPIGSKLLTQYEQITDPAKRKVARDRLAKAGYDISGLN